MVNDMRRSRELIKQTEEQLRHVLAQTDYKIESMDGINVVTAVELVAEIGDIYSFSSADKPSAERTHQPTNNTYTQRHSI